MVFFVLKKIVSQFFMPVPLVLMLIIAGLILFWFTRRQTAAKITVTVAAFILLLAGFGTVSDILLAKLERMYPTIDISSARKDGVKWVVVLAGGHSTDPDMPTTSQLVPETQVRLNEGIRIYRSLPHAKLLVSGGKVFGSKSSAGLMAELARELGVNQRDIVLEDRSWDTDDEARIIRSMVGKDRIVLVTSAYHMPRSMALFMDQGMQPIPAPTGHYIHNHDGLSPTVFFPNADKIRFCEIVAHEVLGLLSLQIREELGP